MACVYIHDFTLWTFSFHRWKLHNLIKNRVLDTTTKAISFYSSAILSPRSPHYRFKMDFVLFLWLPRESCPINCAKVYFLSNYYIHKYLMPLYKSLSLFNKRERYISEGSFWLLKHKTQWSQSHLEIAFDCCLQKKHMRKVKP